MTLGRENVTFGMMIKHHDVIFYTCVMQIMLHAHESMMMSVYDITENTL